MMGVPHLPGARPATLCCPFFFKDLCIFLKDSVRASGGGEPRERRISSRLLLIVEQDMGLNPTTPRS